MYTMRAPSGGARPFENCSRRREVGRKRESVTRWLTLLEVLASSPLSSSSPMLNDLASGWGCKQYRQHRR